MTALHQLDSRQLADYAEARAVVSCGTEIDSENTRALILAMADRLRELAANSRDPKYPKERTPRWTNDTRRLT